MKEMISKDIIGLFQRITSNYAMVSGPMGVSVFAPILSLFMKLGKSDLRVLFSSTSVTPNT